MDNLNLKGSTFFIHPVQRVPEEKLLFKFKLAR